MNDNNHIDENSEEMFVSAKKGKKGKKKNSTQKWEITVGGVTENTYHT